MTYFNGLCLSRLAGLDFLGDIRTLKASGMVGFSMETTTSVVSEMMHSSRACLSCSSCREVESATANCNPSSRLFEKTQVNAINVANMNAPHIDGVRYKYMLKIVFLDVFVLNVYRCKFSFYNKKFCEMHNWSVIVYVRETIIENMCKCYALVGKGRG